MLMKRAVPFIALVLTAAVAFATGKVAQTSNGPTLLKAADLKWGPAFPGAPENGPKAAIAWGDPVKGPVGIFLKQPAGANSGLHTHTGDYRGVIIQGAVTATESDDPKAEGLLPGSFYSQPGKALHNNKCVSTEDCIIYIEFPNSGIDFLPNGKPLAAAPAPKK